MGKPRPLFHFFLVFSKNNTLQFLQQINVKNVRPVYGARIQNHDLSNMSRRPKPLDQGSRPREHRCFAYGFIVTKTQMQSTA